MLGGYGGPGVDVIDVCVTKGYGLLLQGTWVYGRRVSLDGYVASLLGTVEMLFPKRYKCFSHGHGYCIVLLLDSLGWLEGL